MSHEIRTPLNAIVGFSKLIMTEEDVESQKEYSSIIDSNADLLLQLINDILDLSKIEAGTLDFVFNEFDFNDLCTDMLEIHRMKTSDAVLLILRERWSRTDHRRRSKSTGASLHQPAFERH